MGREVTRDATPAPAEGESATGSGSTSSTLGSTHCCPRQCQLSCVAQDLTLEHSRDQCSLSGATDLPLTLAAQNQPT